MGDPVQMTNAQLRALIAGCTGGQGREKVEKLSSTEPADWRTWRRSFEVAVRINGWNHQRARRTAQCSMTGAAAIYVEDIPINDEIVAPAVDCADYQQLLDLYQDRFMPRAAVDHLRAVLKSAKQHENEGVVAWHQRARSLYMRAYPDATAAEVAVNSDVIDTFVFGLTDIEVRRRVWHEHPRTYTAALTAAQNACSGQLMPALQDPGSSRTTSSANLPELGALGTVGAIDGAAGPSRQVGQLGGRQCWECGRAGHIQRHCPSSRNGGRGGRNGPKGNFGGPRGGRGGPRGRGGRGRYGGGGRGGRNDRDRKEGRKFSRAEVLRSLNAMSDADLEQIAGRYVEDDDQHDGQYDDQGNE